MFIMLDIRKTGLTGEEFAWQLLNEENVGTMPGESFGSGGAGHIRVALTVESEVLQEASLRIRRLADTCLAERNQK
jgi:arginine:pyruvate transaminase